ncbi:MAG: hypothetical protein ACK4SY_07975, partial [Pyrobaculum sp.]
YYAAGPSEDFWVYWDNLAVRYSACVPEGWQKGGNVWVSYDYLLVTGGFVYIQPVSGALTYISNFTGVGKYLAFSPTLQESFGVYWNGVTAGCIFGVFQPGSRYVELRPLSGLGDIIVRDQNGAALLRHQCQNPQTGYIGYKTQPGEILKVYLLEAWG